MAKKIRKEKHAVRPGKSITAKAGKGHFSPDRSVIYIAVIALLGLLAYSNSFSVPFQWDEDAFFEENPIIKDISYFSDTSKAEKLGSGFHERAIYLKSRYFAYLSFALNYRIHGFNVFGYHLVNFLIHILNAVIVYGLVLFTFRTPFLKQSVLAERSRMIAFFSSLIFVVHPVQIEAVTYIYQRTTSLVAFFYLLSLLGYSGYRISSIEEQTDRSGQRNHPAIPIAWYVLSLTAAVCAMKTKENAFTLPIVIAAFEFFFFSGSLKRRIASLLPFAMTLAIIPMTLINIQKPLGEMLGELNAATERAGDTISRMNYLFTQFRVLVTYIRLLIFPVDQNLDYYFPVSKSFFELRVILSFIFLSSIVLLGGWLFIRSRAGRKELRLVSFGIFWFFMAHAVESSIVPIGMIIDEYRVYLPSVGAFISVAAALPLIIEGFVRGPYTRIYISLLLIAAGILTIASYRRNIVWQTREGLWADVVRKAPLNQRAHNNLGNAYLQTGDIKKAVLEYQQTISLSPDHADAHHNICSAYNRLGLNDKAIEHCTKALKLKPDRMKTYNNLGNAYSAKGLYEKAKECYLIALKMDSSYPDTHNNLGAAYMSTGMTEMAMEHFKIALKLKPDYADAHSNLGNLYMSRNQTDDAINEYLLAIKLKPRLADSYNNVGVAYSIKKMPEKAEEYFRKAAELNPYYANPRLNLGRLYLARKEFKKARMEFEAALKIRPDLSLAVKYLDEMNKRGL